MTTPQLDFGDFFAKRGERLVGKTLGPYVKILEEAEVVTIETALSATSKEKTHRGMLSFIPIPKIVHALQQYHSLLASYQSNYYQAMYQQYQQYQQFQGPSSTVTQTGGFYPHQLAPLPVQAGQNPLTIPYVSELIEPLITKLTIIETHLKIKDLDAEINTEEKNEQRPEETV